MTINSIATTSTTDHLVQGPRQPGTTDKTIAQATSAAGDRSHSAPELSARATDVFCQKRYSQKPLEVNGRDLAATLETYPYTKKVSVNGPLREEDIAVIPESKMLQHLELSDCSQLTKKDISKLLKKFPELCQLRVSGCPKIHLTDDFANELFSCYKKLGVVISELPYTKTKFSYPQTWVHVRGSALADTLTRFLETKGVTVNGPLTQNNIVKIPHWSMVRSLVLSGCTALTNDVFSALIKKFHKLIHLDVSGCPKLTDAAFESLNCPRLIHLDVSGCDVTYAGIRALLNKFPKLYELQVSNCPNFQLTDDLVKELFNDYPNLEVIGGLRCPEKEQQTQAA